MKKRYIKPLLVLLTINLLIMGCTSLVSEPAEEPLLTTTTQSEPDETIDVPSSEEDIIVDRFSIQADEDLKEPISALYKALFSNEEPVFVEVGGDLLVTSASENSSERDFLPATFLPGSVLLPQVDLVDVKDFVAFALSPDGQQVLIDAGALPATVTLTDQAGNTVEISQPVRRVISSYGPATSLFYAVGAEDRLVSASYLGARDPLGKSAMGRIDPRFPEIMGDDFFTQQDFNVEEAATLDPDLIITSARTDWLDTVDQLGIPVFLFEAESPTLLREAILLTGQVFGPHSSAQANAWVAYYDMVVEYVLNQTADISEEERINVLFTGTSPLRVASGEMYQTNIIETAGARSASSELVGYWNDINLEQVVIWDPDVIIVPPYGGATVEAITESPEWQILDAVAEGRVYQMPKLVVPWDTPAPDSVLGIIWMAQLLYPERIGLDCSEEVQYFYNTFYQYQISAEEIDNICTIE